MYVLGDLNCDLLKAELDVPERISECGVIHTGLSDHSVVFSIRKICVAKEQENVIDIRNMKRFND